MSSHDDSDPIANTEMFRRFTAEEVEAKSSRGRGPLLVVLLAVLVVAIVVAAILVLR
jgi:hypothetical protein